MSQPEIGLEPDAPRAAPQTDPTNPYHQEATGIWLAAERAEKEPEKHGAEADQEMERHA